MAGALSFLSSFNLHRRARSIPPQQPGRAGVNLTQVPAVPDAEPESEHPTESVVSSMFEVFIPCRSQWQKVHVRYKDAWSEKTGFASLPKDTSFPLLEELYLEKSYWLEQDDLKCGPLHRYESEMVYQGGTGIEKKDPGSIFFFSGLWVD